MAANTQPIFPLIPNIAWATITSSNPLTDGTGTSSQIFTAGINGSRIDQITVEHLGSNIATVLRLFVNNGGTSSIASNNSLAYEVGVSANVLTQTAASVGFDLLLNKDGGSTTAPPIPYLPAGYTIRGSVGATITAGVRVTVFGGDY